MPSFQVIVTIPPEITDLPARLKRGVEVGHQDVAAQVITDFQRTSATWQHKPQFTIVGSAGNVLTAGTDDQVYSWVNDGTPAHEIMAHGKALTFMGGGSPKTAPGIIGSSSGSRGSGMVFRRRVHHPGVKARAFDVAIAKEVEAKDAEPLMTGAIVEALK